MSVGGGRKRDYVASVRPAFHTEFSPRSFNPPILSSTAILAYQFILIYFEYNSTNYVLRHEYFTLKFYV